MNTIQVSDLLRTRSPISNFPSYLSEKLELNEITMKMLRSKITIQRSFVQNTLYFGINANNQEHHPKNSKFISL